MSQVHHVLLHGRNSDKLKDVEAQLSILKGNGRVEGYIADLSKMAAVKELAESVVKQHAKLDVLINNAGVYTTAKTSAEEGLDVRFAVNTLAPCLLTQKLLPL